MAKCLFSNGSASAEKTTTINVYGGAYETITLGDYTTLTNENGLGTMEVKESDVGKSFTPSCSVSGYDTEVTLSADTYCMPSGALYWYGNDTSNSLITTNYRNYEQKYTNGALQITPQISNTNSCLSVYFQASSVGYQMGSVFLTLPSGYSKTRIKYKNLYGNGNFQGSNNIGILNPISCVDGYNYGNRYNVMYNSATSGEVSTTITNSYLAFALELYAYAIPSIISYDIEYILLEV